MMKRSFDIYMWLCAAFLAMVAGCTREEPAVGNAGVLKLGVSVRSILGQTVDGVAVSSVRIVAVDPSTGWVAVNKTTAGGGLQDTGIANGAGNFTVSLNPGTYRVYVIGNETPAMAAMLNGLTDGNLIENLTVQTPHAETDLVLFNRTSITVRPRGGSHSSATGEVMVDGQEVWLQNLPVTLERLAAKVTFALKKNTANASDQFTVKRVAIVQLPLYSYAVPRAYDGGAFRNIILYDNAAGTPFTQNGGTAVSFGGAVVPEYLLATQSADYASSIKVLANYNNTADVVYTIPLRRDLAVSDWNLYRNSRYDVTATITQVGSLDYTPYIEYGVSPWTDATGEDLSIGGSITFTGSWSASTPAVSANTVAVYSNSYAEYSFTLAYPAGATWRASLTNGLDFTFDYSDNAVSSGVAAPGQPYTIRVKPLRPVSANGTQTKMYITVSNVASQTELDLVPSQPGVRYTVTQIPQ